MGAKLKKHTPFEIELVIHVTSLECQVYVCIVIKLLIE